jgi:hypothetical protein
MSVAASKGLCAAAVPRRAPSRRRGPSLFNDDGQEKNTVDHNQTDPMLQHFRWKHLPPHLQEVSKPFGQQAAALVRKLPRNPERTAALRHLLEAKDCAVRSVLPEAVVTVDELLE